MDEQLKKNLTSSKQWFRLFYMILLAACLYVAGLLVWLVIPIQALFVLISGEPNVNLRRFGQSLSAYFFQILSFLTYNSEEKPFPFSDWPVPEEDEYDDVLEGEVEVANEHYDDELEDDFDDEDDADLVDEAEEHHEELHDEDQHHEKDVDDEVETEK